MQVNITGKHLEITSAISDYVNGKFKKLEKHSEKIMQSHVVLSVEKQMQKVEAKLVVNGQEVNADAASETLYAAVDALIDKLDRQLLKIKGKKIANRTRS